MKTYIRVFLLLATAACGFYALAGIAGAQDAPTPPTPPAPPSFIPPVPPLSPMTPFNEAAPAPPASPAVPAVPASLGEPGWPDWDHRHSVSISDGHHQPVTDCSDLRIRFDDRDAVMKSEERTLTKADAPTLRVRPHTNGGVQVEGWNKDVYSVVACKAAANYDGDAERVLSQIKLSVQSGEVSTSGPDGEHDWTVYLLIRAPKASVIDLETANGPISLYSVDGKLTARATNGPITLRDFSGDADVRASNGPITITGSSGNVHVHTENGPISINLTGKTWSGAGLSADAQNGPLTLSVPADYQSSFSVESRNYSPMSCRASICDNARKTWDDNNRRIEFGASPAMIRLSTVNGPVSVRSSREEM
ncbi:MAG TPA: hypothetical protein VNH65_08230 [Candidatus Acidoferrum sp.]|nr:hypothetical protein [Candidatus Acidoferrum sp.]